MTGKRMMLNWDRRCLDFDRYQGSWLDNNLSDMGIGKFTRYLIHPVGH